MGKMDGMINWEWTEKSSKIPMKIAGQAEGRWRKLNRSQLLAHVIRGVVFTDGVMEKAA